MLDTWEVVFCSKICGASFFVFLLEYAKLTYFVQLTDAVNFDLGLEIQSLPKCPFLTVFSKTYFPTKVDVLGPWEVSILFRNAWHFFFALYRVP